MFYINFKIFYDSLGALIGIFLLSPLYLLTIILIKIDPRGSILFKQNFIERNKKHFYILKLRTLKHYTSKNIQTHLLENPENYITKMGKFLRKTILDELSQIINSLKDNMSNTGPRSALWNQFEFIVETDKYGVHKFYAGITDYSQIKGRNILFMPEKTSFDGEYVRRTCLGFNIKIFISTSTIDFRSVELVEGMTGINNKSDISIQTNHIVNIGDSHE
jgi:O-antigen biosynthesis protein WbqP